jgi:hypothetical protein
VGVQLEIGTALVDQTIGVSRLAVDGFDPDTRRLSRDLRLRRAACRDASERKRDHGAQVSN